MWPWAMNSTSSWEGNLKSIRIAAILAAVVLTFICMWSYEPAQAQYNPPATTGPTGPKGATGATGAQLTSQTVFCSAPGTCTGRAITTVYQNTTGVVLWVSVGAEVPASTQNKLLTDANSTPSAVYAACTNPAAIASGCSMTVPVLPNNYYELTGSVVSASLTWSESH